MSRIVIGQGSQPAARHCREKTMGYLFRNRSRVQRFWVLGSGFTVECRKRLKKRCNRSRVHRFSVQGMMSTRNHNLNRNPHRQPLSLPFSFTGRTKGRVDESGDESGSRSDPHTLTHPHTLSSLLLLTDRLRSGCILYLPFQPVILRHSTVNPEPLNL